MSPAEQEKAAPQLPPAVNIHRGDLIEFLVGERTWFLVEVTGRGKLGGKNQNYLNVRYRYVQMGPKFTIGPRMQWDL